MAWAKTPEDEIPEEVEKRSAMEERYGKDIQLAEKVIDRKTKDYNKRVIVIANSHASIATIAAAKELNIPLDELMDKMGEVPEAEGLKYDFYQGEKDKEVKPFGKGIEVVVNELK